MKRNEIHVVIKLYVLKEKTVTLIKIELNSISGNTSPALCPIYTWIIDIKRKRQSYEDVPVVSMSKWNHESGHDQNM